MSCFVYLDESGDTGFKFYRGSSIYFVITILIVQDPIPLNSAIADLRQHLHYRDDHEFKFTRSKPATRLQFIGVLRRHEVLIRTLVVDKRRLTLPHMRTTDIFYNYLVNQLLTHDDGRITDATLILDERQKGKKSKQQLSTYLRRQLNAGDLNRVAAIKYHQSHRDNLLQAVDMASGAINAHFASGEHTYFNALRVKIDDVWEFMPRAQ